VRQVRRAGCGSFSRRVWARPTLAAVLAAGFFTLPAAAGEAGGFWGEQRRGANFFNKVETRARLDAAKNFGVDFVRLTFDKWRGERRDFLAGSLDVYAGLVPADLARLGRVLDAAAAAGVKVVLTPLGLPGARWVQLNGRRHDGRLWRDKVYWDQAAAYWRDIATAFKGHPALVAYNIVNEPVPENGYRLPEGDIAERDRWCAAAKGTARDLDAFYRHMVAAIRAVDATIPIVLDTGSFGQPAAVRCLTPIADDNLIYAVHLYAPYDFTSHENRGRFTYPGVVRAHGRAEYWDRERLAKHLSPFLEWAEAKDVPRSRLMVGEFGCVRWNKGCDAYLADVVSLVEEAGLHWAFYSFREDAWDGYDYELGTGSPKASVGAALQRREQPRGAERREALMGILRRVLAGRS